MGVYVLVQVVNEGIRHIACAGLGTALDGRVDGAWFGALVEGERSEDI